MPSPMKITSRPAFSVKDSPNGASQVLVQEDGTLRSFITSRPQDVGTPAPRGIGLRRLEVTYEFFLDGGSDCHVRFLLVLPGVGAITGAALTLLLLRHLLLHLSSSAPRPFHIAPAEK